MQLAQMTWQEVEHYLGEANGILLGTGSTEQHGPIGLIGTDAICADTIATAVADEVTAIVAPPLPYAPAPFNTAFPGTISITPDLFQMLCTEIFSGLAAQGFSRIYVINGHGANLQPLVKAANQVAQARIKIKSWWDTPEVRQLINKLYGDWEGMHATPSEVAVTQHLTGIVHDGAKSPPEKLSADFIRAHAGDKHGPPHQHRQSFPCGRVGSHSALAQPSHGRLLFETAVTALSIDYQLHVSG